MFQRLVLAVTLFFLALTGCKSAKLEVVRGKPQAGQNKKSLPTNANPQTNFSPPSQDLGDQSNPTPNQTRTTTTANGPGTGAGTPVASSPAPTPATDMASTPVPDTAAPSNGPLRPRPRPSTDPRPQATTTPQANSPAVNTAPQATGPRVEIKGLMECGEDGAQCPKPPPVAGKCDAMPISSTLIRPKLNLLFVLDTSASLWGGTYKSVGGELGLLAKNIGSFIEQLGPNVDLRIGMLLAHGPASANHAKLYSNPRNKQDPGPVIEVAKIRAEVAKQNPNVSVEQRNKAVQDKIASILSKRITDKLPIEHKGAEGEAMLLSIYDFFAKNDTQGFITDRNTPTNVIIVSDEQDVCFDYAAHGLQPRPVSVRDAKGKVSEAPSPVETKFYNSDACQKAVGGKQLTTEAVFNSMTVKVDKNQLIITSLVYKDNNVPRGSQDENEMGHGMIELAALAGGNGSTPDLAKLDESDESTFKDMQAEMGKFTAGKMNFPGEYGCSSETDPYDVDPATVVMKFFNERHQELASFRGDCRTRGCRGSNGRVSWKVVQAKNAVGGRYGVLSVPPYILATALASTNGKGTVEVTFLTKQK